MQIFNRETLAVPSMGSSTSRRLPRTTEMVAVGGVVLGVLLLSNYAILLAGIPEAPAYVRHATNSNIPQQPKPSTVAWEEIQRHKASSSSSASSSWIGIHALQPGRRPPTNVVVIGERHSGTTFFTKHLSECFPGVTVGDTFVNGKHWYQPDPGFLRGLVAGHKGGGGGAGGAPSSSYLPGWLEIVDGTTHDGVQTRNQRMRDNNEKNHSIDSYFRDSLVLVLFRNPYDW